MNENIWNLIYGNKAVKNTFVSDIEGKRLAHAFIIEGIKGSGKLTLARVVLASMQTEQKYVDQIMNGVCSDIVEIDVPDDKKKIGVDAVRLIRTGSVIKAGELEMKAYIIENCDQMTVQAQNAFLKILEEPTKDVYFFLLTTNASALLPTVRSRAPVVRTEVFGSQELKEYLIVNLPLAAQLNRQTPERLDAVVQRSGGAIGVALEELNLISEGKFSTESSIIKVLESIKDGGRYDVMSYLNEFCSTREDAEQFLKMLRMAVRDIMVIKSHSVADMTIGKVEVLEYFAMRLSVNKLLTFDMKIEEMIFDLEHFPNIWNFKLNVFKTLWEALR